MTVIARIERKTGAWTITLKVDNANCIAFDAVEIRLHEDGARLFAVSANGNQLVVFPDIILCSDRLRNRMVFGEDDDAQETVQKE